MALIEELRNDLERAADLDIEGGMLDAVFSIDRIKEAGLAGLLDLSFEDVMRYYVALARANDERGCVGKVERRSRDHPVQQDPLAFAVLGALLFQTELHGDPAEFALPRFSPGMTGSVSIRVHPWLREDAK